MPKTSVVIVPIKQDAFVIKEDATFTMAVGTLQSFSDLNDLQNSLPAQNPYATFEPNFWILDGNIKIADTTAVVGIMTTDISDSSGEFSTNPKITINFSESHSTDGITLHGSSLTNDFADHVLINFYDVSNMLIQSDEYTAIGDVHFFTNQPVSDFEKIEITFYGTNKNNRFLRFTGIDFNTFIVFDNENVKKANIIEQVNLLSLELPYNKLDLTLYSADGDFSIVDPQGFYANLKYNEPFDVYENVLTDVIFMGRFYLNQWNSENENEVELNCVDAIGTDEINNSYYYTNYESLLHFPVTDIIEDILSSTQFDYEIDSELASEVIYGWLPVLSKRESIMQIAFAIGAYVTCSRSKKILFKKFPLASDLSSFDYIITKSQKGINSPLSLKKSISSIKILENSYNFIEQEKSIFNNYLSVGENFVNTNLILYTAYVDSTTGSYTFFSTTANNFTIIVSSAGNFSINASSYWERITNEYTLNNNDIPENAQINIININDVPLITKSFGVYNLNIVENVAQRVYDYYQQRYFQKTKLFASPIAVGNSVLIDTQSNKQVAGIVEKMEINLTGGFVSNVEITGVIYS